MRVRRRAAAASGLAVLGSGALLALTLGGGTAAAAGTVRASALPAGAVPFSQAVFSGYGTGTEVHVGALTLPGTSGGAGTQVAGIDQAFSGAATKFGGSGAGVGLSSTIDSELGTVVAPGSLGGAVNAYGNGVGLQVGLGTSNPATSNTSQVQLAGLATQQAPPNGAPVVQSAAVPSSVPSAVVSGGVLNGKATAFFDPTGCPLGQPISYGLGNATNVSALDLGALTGQSSLTGGPALNLSGAAGNGTAESTSYTYLNNNGDGTFGLAAQSTETIAPVTVNIGGAIQLHLQVVTANGSDAPVSLTAVTTGESGGGAVTFSSAGIVQLSVTANGQTTQLVDIPLSAIGPSGLHVPLSVSGLSTALSTLSSTVSSTVSTINQQAGSTLSSALSAAQGVTSTLTGALSQVLSAVPANISLGSLDIDVTPHAIGQPATTPATTTGGTAASGALDLLKLDVDPTATVNGTALPVVNIANVALGHLEDSAATSAPIVCPLPVIKSVDQQSVTAGSAFTYTIQIPDPAKLADLACSLTSVSATDVISDYKGTPTFKVTGASNSGTVSQADANHAQVDWTGLSYTRAAAGQPATPPITLTINVSVPSSSPAGTIQDVVNATGTAANCQDYATGLTNVGNVNGAVLTGSYTLQAPAVTTTPAAPAQAPAATLPTTGGTGGLWQPLGGLGALVVGGGAVWALRRSRRMSS